MFGWLKEWWEDLIWCLRGPDFLPSDHGYRRAIDPPPRPREPQDEWPEVTGGAYPSIEIGPWMGGSGGIPTPRKAKTTDLMPPQMGGDGVFADDVPVANGWGPFHLPYQETSRDERKSGNVTKPPPIRKDATAAYKNWREAEAGEHEMIAGRIGQWAGEPDANLPKSS